MGAGGATALRAAVRKVSASSHYHAHSSACNRLGLHASVHQLCGLLPFEEGAIIVLHINEVSEARRT